MDLREHLTAHHPGIRQANYMYPEGRPLPDLEIAHRMQHQQFPNDHQHEGIVTRAQLAEYLAAKSRYEDMVAAAAVTYVPGQPWPAEVKAQERRVEALKEAGGYGEELWDAPCCRRYGRLHEPAFSLPGCPWLLNLQSATPGSASALRAS